MSPKELHDYFKAARRKAETNLRVATQTAAAFAEDEAHRLSLGTFKAKGEYAKRNPRPPQDPAIINKIERRNRRGAPHLEESWRLQRVSGEHFILVNDAPHAGYMESGPKSTMIRRPIIDRVAERTDPVLRKLVDDAIDRALGK